MSNPAHLDAGQLCWLSLQRGETVRCLAGSLWLTAGAEDIVLHAGQVYRAHATHAVLCQALQACRMQQQPALPARPQNGGQPHRWFASLIRQWLPRIWRSAG
ncbi:MAG: DUF2917 domain-containing protein [Burkholderiales bacterium]|jgi:hypothetical protein